MYFSAFSEPKMCDFDDLLLVSEYSEDNRYAVFESYIMIYMCNNYQYMIYSLW